MTTPRDIEDMTDAQDEARATVKPEYPVKPLDLSNLIRLAILHGRGYRCAPETRKQVHHLTEDDQAAIMSFDPEGLPCFDRLDDLVAATWKGHLARPSQAGVIRPLCWIDDTESKCTRAYAPALGGKMMVVELDPGSGEYSAGIDLSGLCFRFVLDTYHDGLGAFTAPAKFPSIEAAKSAAQADYEARVSSSLVETVGVEALVSFARPFADALDIECDFMTPPAPFEDGFDVRHRARAALAAMDTPKGGGDE